jgi:hypothetical protein
MDTWVSLALRFVLENGHGAAGGQAVQALVRRHIIRDTKLKTKDPTLRAFDLA